MRDWTYLLKNSPFIYFGGARRNRPVRTGNGGEWEVLARERAFFVGKWGFPMIFSSGVNRWFSTVYDGRRKFLKVFLAISRENEILFSAQRWVSQPSERNASSLDQSNGVFRGSFARWKFTKKTRQVYTTFHFREAFGFFRWRSGLDYRKGKWTMEN